MCVPDELWHKGKRMNKLTFEVIQVGAPRVVGSSRIVLILLLLATTDCVSVFPLGIRIPIAFPRDPWG